MRILHVNKFLYRRGGAEGYLQDVADLQAQAGHDVEFFGMAHPSNDPHTYSSLFPEHLEFEPAPPGVAGKLRTFGRMMWSTSAMRGIDEVVERFRPDVVHLHNIYHQLSPSVLRPLAARGIPCVLTLHDYKLACPTYQFLDKGELCQACLTGGFRQAVKRRCKDGSLAASAAAAVELGVHRRFGAYDSVGRFLCPSRFLAGAMAQSGIAADRLHVLNNFTDTVSVSPQDRIGRGIVFAGRLSEEKGVDVLVDATGILHREETDAGSDRAGLPLLDIVGDGPARAALEDQAQRVAPGRVRFHGRLPKDQLLDVVRGAAVAAVPSRWYENQPLAVLEAFACGVPVVGTRLGGLPELLDDGEDGFLVPHDDAVALAAALRPLLRDPELGHAMGKAARAKAETAFSPAAHLDAVLAHYDAVSRQLRGDRPSAIPCPSDIQCSDSQCSDSQCSDSQCSDIPLSDAAEGAA